MDVQGRAAQYARGTGRLPLSVRTREKAPRSSAFPSPRRTLGSVACSLPPRGPRVDRRTHTHAREGGEGFRACSWAARVVGVVGAPPMMSCGRCLHTRTAAVARRSAECGEGAEADMATTTCTHGRVGNLQLFSRSQARLVAARRTRSVPRVQRLCAPARAPSPEQRRRRPRRPAAACRLPPRRWRHRAPPP